MNRLAPPSIPLWILEHLTPPEREDALAGDLLEEYRSGRSNGWFWRQALGAWLGAWTRYFARRRSLLLFALLFGSTQIPKLARSLGAASKEFRDGAHHGIDGDTPKP